MVLFKLLHFLLNWTGELEPSTVPVKRPGLVPSEIAMPYINEELQLPAAQYNQSNPKGVFRHLIAVEK